MNPPHLQPLRQAIDGLDDALVTLLACRAELSRQAQDAKTRAGVAVLDVEREAQIGRRYEHAAPGAGSVAAAILEWCRR